MSSFTSVIALACTLYAITPSDNGNPKASTYWEYARELEGVSLSVGEKGVQLKGLMVNKVWETFGGEVTDWNITIEFNGPFSDKDPYNRLWIDTLTGTGFLYINYSKSHKKPSYGVVCVPGKEGTGG